MLISKPRSLPLLLALLSSPALLAAPALAASSVTTPIVDPSNAWAGIAWWGVNISQFSTVDQTLTFTVADDSKIDIFMQGTSRFQFTDVLLNGASIASDFTLASAPTLQATGYAAAGTVSLTFQADYTCRDCWGDWFGGYVQVSQAALPLPVLPLAPTPAPAPAPFPDGLTANPIPEPASWAMMIAGLGLVGAAMRHRARTRARTGTRTGATHAA